MKHVGKFVLRAAKEKGMSLRALARESGVSNCYRSQVTRGYFIPTPEILLKLAPSLGVTPRKMFEEAGWLKRKSTKGGQAKKK
jgi:transcriptional regulator with XRE-family HTH domain